MSRWSVRYFCDEDGSLPVAEFFAQPSRIGITLAEKVKFVARLERIQEVGLELLQRESDLLESLKGVDNLFSIRSRNKSNNPRVLACALEGHRTIVLLHAFKELDRKAYKRAIPVAVRRRDLVVKDPVRWVCDHEIK